MLYCLYNTVIAYREWYPIKSTLTNCSTVEDVCTLPAEVGPCDAVELRWYFDTPSGKCDVFEYGGCEGNGNNFRSEDDCESRCGGES